MKLFIPTSGYWNHHTAAQALDSCYPTLLVPNEKQADQYRKLSSRGSVQIGELGAALRRDCERDEWVIIAHETFLGLTGVEPDLYGEEALATRNGASDDWRRSFSYRWDAGAFLVRLVPECCRRAEAEGARLVGFAATDNPYFRGRKWRSVAFAPRRLLLWRHDPDYDWDERHPLVDYRDTSEHLRRYGRVLLNNWLFPRLRFPERTVDPQAALRLVREYPGLWQYQERLKLKLTTPEEVDGWPARQQGK